ncbi:MAG: pyruvate formate lyase family protein [Lentisphaeria bacterium]|jgi:pyruvate-formate lyase
MFNTFAADKPYLQAKFKTPTFAADSGVDNATVKRRILELADGMPDAPHPVVKGRAFELVAREIQIDVSKHDWFPAFGCFNRHDRPLSVLTQRWDREVNATRIQCRELWDAMNKSSAGVMWKDFDHSVPDWDAVFTLGFPGLRERARQYRRRHEEQGTLTPEMAAYFDGIEITYTAILAMLRRFRDLALTRRGDNPRAEAVAACLQALHDGPPQDTYQVLQLVYLFFMFGEHIDRFQVRSLGNLDRTVMPYYRRDLDSGRYSEAQVREFFAYFLMQWAGIDNYWGHPFYFGGTRADGESEINELSYLILEVYDQLGIWTPKLQLKVSPNTPQPFIDLALDMIRRGHNSLVFLCEPGMWRAMMSKGFSAEEARTCFISGCYEFGALGRSNGTAAGHINMLKPLEFVFNDGVDPYSGLACGRKTGALSELQSFEDFYQAYLTQLEGIIENIITCATDFEKDLHIISPAQVFSATITNSLETGRDAFSNGSVHNLAAILQAGFGTAVDALMAVKELVYETKQLSLEQLREILANNWQGQEKLRLRLLHNPRKFGNGIAEVDALAQDLARFLGGKINGRPNGRGGIFVASAHSAKQFLDMGVKTGATPDGRLAGDEMSKNISPTMGMDRAGVTAMISSITSIDSALFPGDFPLDVMLHPTTVAGDDGLAAMRGLLFTYMQRNGIAIHFNVFDASVLRDAQANPDKYQGLQVRVCGWNVLFNNMAKKEQDAYIFRAENIRD